MSLIFMESWDYVDSTTELGRKWDELGSLSLGVSSGRRGGGAILPFTHIGKIVPAQTTYIVGSAIKDLTGVAGDIFEFMEGSTVHVSVFKTAQGGIQVFLGTGSTQLGSEAPAFTLRRGGWYYVEASVTIDGTVGAFEIRVNGVNVASGTNLDTDNGGAVGEIDKIRLRGTSSQVVHCDNYIVDTTGAAPTNTFLGDVQCDAVRPDGAGNYAQFDSVFPADGIHWDKCDEQYVDDDTTYIETPTASDRDSFTFEALPALTGGDTVFGVQLNVVARKTEAGAQNIIPFLRVGGTDYDGTSVALGESYLNYSEIWEQNPDTGPSAWTTAGVDGAEAGVEAV